MTAIIEKIRNVENDLEYMPDGWVPRDYVFKHQVLFRDSETNERYVKHFDIWPDALEDGSEVVTEMLQDMLDRWLKKWQCKMCKDKGEIACWACDGKEHNGIGAVCARCNGSGFIVCPRCKGEGK